MAMEPTNTHGYLGQEKAWQVQATAPKATLKKRVWDGLDYNIHQFIQTPDGKSRL